MNQSNICYKLLYTVFCTIVNKITIQRFTRKPSDVVEIVIILTNIFGLDRYVN